MKRLRLLKCANLPYLSYWKCHISIIYSFDRHHYLESNLFIEQLCSTELKRDVTENVTSLLILASCRTLRIDRAPANVWINARIYTSHRCVDILPEITWRYFVPVAQHRSSRSKPKRATQVRSAYKMHS